MKGKNYGKKVPIAVILSVIPCIVYAIIQFCGVNLYIYTTLVKIGLFVCFPVLYAFTAKDKSLVEALKPRKSTALGISAIIGVIVAAAIIGGFFLLRRFFNDAMILGALESEGITRSNFPFVFLNIVVVNAFLEELFFRGFIFFSLYRQGCHRFAYLYSSALFAIYHVSMISSWFSPFIFVLCMIGLFVGGLIFDETDRRCGNIFGSYIIHAGANLGINAIGIYLFLSQ